MASIALNHSRVIRLVRDTVHDKTRSCCNLRAHLEQSTRVKSRGASFKLPMGLGTHRASSSKSACRGVMAKYSD